MKILLFVLLLGKLPITSEAPAVHPIHLTVTEFFTDEDTDELTFAITFFMDDFSVAAEYEKYQNAINNGKMSTNDFILNYLKKKLKVKVNDKTIQYKIKDTESNFPSVTCTMQLKNVPQKLERIEVENNMLHELFRDQKNMVHIRIDGKKEGSMILNRKKKVGLVDL